MKRCRETGCKTEVKGRQQLCYLHLLWRAERETVKQKTASERYPGVPTQAGYTNKPTPPITGEVTTKVIRGKET